MCRVREENEQTGEGDEKAGSGSYGSAMEDSGILFLYAHFSPLALNIRKVK